MVTDFFSQLFMSLCDRIEAEVPAIKWIDRDLGQLEDYKERPPVQFPCVLIDFPSFNFKDEGENVQWGDGVIQLRIGFAPYSSANAAAPTQYREIALSCFNIESDVYKAMQGWEPVYNDEVIAQPLSRVASASEIREDSYMVRSIQYSTAGEDAGAQTVRIRRNAKMNIQR